MKIWLSFLTVIIVFIAICLANLYCNNTPTEGDNASVLVSALCVLVTVLIGWNIYQIIDLKSYKSEINYLKNKLDKEVNYAHNKMDYNNGMAFCFRANSHAAALNLTDKYQHKFQMLLHGCNGIKILSNLEEYECCDSCAFVISDASHMQAFKMPTAAP